MQPEDQEQEIELQQEPLIIGGKVDSVNGQTGDVVLTTSDLENTANFQNANDVANSISAHNQSTSAHQDIRQLITNEATARYNADNNLQGQIDAITSASDVVDIVGTYADLEAYDTQHLKDNDVIKVLQDETHNDAMTYYRWSTSTHTWTYIGAEGPYYTKSETNTLLDDKLDKSTVPDGFFDGPATITSEKDTSIEIEGGLKLKSIELYGDTTQSTSPSPDDPQTVDVVTGTQTITITDGDAQSETYTVSLGSIELCKIGTYQDYIYKSGDNWYVHKQIGKTVLTGSEIGWNADTYGNAYIAFPTAIGTSSSTAYSNYFTYNPSASIWGEIRFGNTNQNILFIKAITQNTNISGFRTWLSTHNTSVYYALATATDTKITNSTLIGQLNAVLDANLYKPTTTISASGNLTAILSAEAFTENLNSLLEIAGEPNENVFSGTDGVTSGISGLVPAPATTDTNKYLKSDGTWATVSGGGGTSDFDQLTNRPQYNGSVMSSSTDIPKVGTATLTSADATATYDGDDYVEAWNLPSGVYIKEADTNFFVSFYEENGDPTSNALWFETAAIFVVTNSDPTDPSGSTEITSESSNQILRVETDHSGALIDINVISGNFVGTDGVDDGVAGLVPAPSASDEGKFLCADGYWDTPSAPTVVQTTGQSITDVMSQKAVTDLIGNIESALHIINNGGGES